MLRSECFYSVYVCVCVGGGVTLVTGHLFLPLRAGDTHLPHLVPSQGKALS